MKITAIIPSRYESKRFRGKPLVKIGNKTLIERVYRQVEKSKKFASIIVATDDQRIASVVKDFGGDAVLTSPCHPSGTDRIWEVLEKNDSEGVVNIQGDEPFIPETLIAEIFDHLNSGQHRAVSAARLNSTYTDFLSVNVVKVVLDKSGHALYFSRSPIPWVEENEFDGFYQHIGIYGYLRATLAEFVSWSPSPLEKKERLEQLRLLENGVKIKVIETKYQSIGVDIPADVEKIEQILRGKNG